MTLGTQHCAIKALVAEIQIASHTVSLVNIRTEIAYLGDVIVVH